MKIWNIPLGTNVMYFLRKFTGHLQHLHMWLFTDLPETTAKKEESVFGTKLDCFLRLLKICDNNDERTHLRHHCRLFGCNFSGQPNKDEIEALESKIRSIAAQLNISRYLYEESIDAAESDYLLKLKELCTMKSDNELVSVKLAMIFLRGMLENEQSAFMSRKCLIELAKKCHLENVDEFCKLFTSFGSIFDLQLIGCSKEEIVIIKPDFFLSKIHKICDCKEGLKDYTQQGIMTFGDVQSFFKQHEEGHMFMSVLCDVGMAACIPVGRYMKEDGTTNTEICYYMPCVRDTMKKEHSTDPNAVHLLLNIQNSPNFVNFEVFLTKFLLDKCAAIHLLSSEKENITRLKNISENLEINFQYMGDHVEISFTTSSHSDSIKTHIVYLLNAFCEIAKEVRSTPHSSGQFTYAIAVVCAIDGHYHVLPDDFCNECRNNEYFNLWRQVLLSNEVS